MPKHYFILHFAILSPISCFSFLLLLFCCHLEVVSLHPHISLSSLLDFPHSNLHVPSSLPPPLLYFMLIIPSRLIIHMHKTTLHKTLHFHLLLQPQRNVVGLLYAHLAG